MKNKLIKNIYQILAIIIFIVTVFFSYIIAEINDAPGFIIIGTSMSALVCYVMFGLGELIDINKKNNMILKDIYNEIKNK